MRQAIVSNISLNATFGIISVTRPRPLHTEVRCPVATDPVVAQSRCDHTASVASSFQSAPLGGRISGSAGPLDATVKTCKCRREG